MTETKHDKFVRLSTARMEKVSFAMKQLTYLNSHNYEFSEQEAEGLISQLRDHTNNVAEALGVAATPVQVEIPEPERRPEPEPEPVAPAEAPRTMEQGPLDLNREETLHLIHVGPQIGAAINAIEDGKSEEAYDLLLNLMRS